MIKRKNLMKKVVVLGVSLLTVLAVNVPASAATNVSTPDIGSNVSAAWLAQGPITQYPSDGGTWTYGFWDVKVRSYYTVNKTHGSSVKLNGTNHRSIDTASGKKSIAEAYAVNIPSNDDHYYYRIC